MTSLDDRTGELERENAELRRRLAERETELAEALGRETANAEVLGVINSSPGDLAPVFGAMLEKATRLCAAPYGILRTWDGERFHFAAAHGDTLFQQWARERPPFAPDLIGGPLGRLVQGEKIVPIVDARAETAYEISAGFREMADASGLRSGIAVGLRRDDLLLGALTVYRREVSPFSDTQTALLQNFAAQAVIAMENARLITETREALEQQTATAEVLGVINSSPGDLAPVFDAIVEKALCLCGAAFGELDVYVGDGKFRLAAVRGVPAAYVEYYGARGLDSYAPDSGPASILAGEQIVHIPDLIDTELYRRGDPHRRALVELGGGRATIMVSLRKDHAVLGYILVYRQEPGPFSRKQIALLQNFAAQAVIAMENARLLGELRARTSDLQESLEYQTATSNLLKVISRSDAELTMVLEAVVETATRLCQADAGNLYLRGEDGLRRMASFGVAAETKVLIDAHPLQPDHHTVSGRTIVTGEIVHIHDIATDPEISQGTTLAIRATLAAGVKTMLGVPLLREDAPIGSLSLGRRTLRPFSDKQIELVRTFADQAVIAIENARLLGELRQRTEEVSELNRGLESRVAEQVEELGRVGRLKRFLAPQLAQLIVSEDKERVLESHRREIVVVFCDLRGFTAFAETAEPEEVLDLLREYHAALGPLVSEYEGTLDHFSGDGIMVFFNDPVPCPDPAERAVKMAVAMRAAAGKLIAAWRRRDRDLGFGVGIAQGYATLGQIGFADRFDYTAIGTVCNLAARLCAEAKDGQILLSGRVAAAVEETVALEQLGSIALKGITQPVAIFNVLDQQVTGASAEVIPLQRPHQQPR